MKIKTVFATFVLLFTLALSGCAGYAVYGYPDYPYDYNYGYYPHGYVSFHHDFDGFHHSYGRHFHGGPFGGGHHEARHWEERR